MEHWVTTDAPIAGFESRHRGLIIPRMTSQTTATEASAPTVVPSAIRATTRTEMQVLRELAPYLRPFLARILFALGLVVVVGGLVLKPRTAHGFPWDRFVGWPITLLLVGFLFTAMVRALLWNRSRGRELGDAGAPSPVQVWR